MAAAVVIGIPTAAVIVLNETRSSALAPLYRWPYPARVGLGLLLCAAVGLTLSLALGAFGVFGWMAVLVSLPLALTYLFWRYIRGWLRRR